METLEDQNGMDLLDEAVTSLYYSGNHQCFRRKLLSCTKNLFFKIRWNSKLEAKARCLFSRAKKKKTEEASRAFKNSLRLCKNINKEVKRESRRQLCSETSTTRDTERLFTVLANAPRSELMFIKKPDGILLKPQVKPCSC